MHPIQNPHHDHDSRTTMNGEYSGEMRSAPVLLVAGGLRVGDGEKFHDASNDEKQSEHDS